MSVNPERSSKNSKYYEEPVKDGRSLREKYGPPGNQETFYTADDPNPRRFSDSYEPFPRKKEIFGHERMSRSEINARLRMPLKIEPHYSMMQDEELLQRSSGIRVYPNRKSHRLPGNAAIAYRQHAAEENRYFLALDIDQCSALGEDTNDILRTASMMIRFACEKEVEANGHIDADAELERQRKLIQIAQLVINPQVLNVYKEIEEKTGHKPYVFAYTNKGDFAEYFEKTINDLVSFMYLPKHSHIFQEAYKSMNEKWGKIFHRRDFKNFWVFLEGDDKDTDYMYLWNKLRNDTFKEIAQYMGTFPYEETIKTESKKLGLITWAISRLLELDYNMPAAVGSLYFKDPRDLLRDLGLSSVNRLYLFDDKAITHNDGMPFTSRFEHNSHMIPVVPYTSFHLHSVNRTMIDRILNSILEPNLRDMFFLKHPSLSRDISVATNKWPADRLIYNVAQNRFEIGGGTLDRYVGSAPPPKWSTDHFANVVHPKSMRIMSNPR